MSSQYFQRNSGVPLLVKLGVLIVACYLIFLLLKVFAVVLAAVFVVVKYLLLVAVFALVGAWLLKALFGIDLLPFGRQRDAKYPYKRNW